MDFANQKLTPEQIGQVLQAHAEWSRGEEDFVRKVKVLAANRRKNER